MICNCSGIPTVVCYGTSGALSHDGNAFPQGCFLQARLLSLSNHSYCSCKVQVCWCILVSSGGLDSTYDPGIAVSEPLRALLILIDVQ